jgi:hypothetical protein
MTGVLVLLLAASSNMVIKLTWIGDVLNVVFSTARIL